MRNNLGKSDHWRDYAKHTSLSVPRFSHLFKQHTDIAPMVYLNELRTQRACDYLDNTGTDIKTIAIQLVISQIKNAGLASEKI